MAPVERLLSRSLILLFSFGAAQPQEKQSWANPWPDARSLPTNPSDWLNSARFSYQGPASIHVRPTFQAGQSSCRQNTISNLALPFVYHSCCCPSHAFLLLAESPPCNGPAFYTFFFPPRYRRHTLVLTYLPVAQLVLTLCGSNVGTFLTQTLVSSFFVLSFLHVVHCLSLHPCHEALQSDRRSDRRGAVRRHLLLVSRFHNPSTEHRMVGVTSHKRWTKDCGECSAQSPKCAERELSIRSHRPCEL